MVTEAFVTGELTSNTERDLAGVVGKWDTALGYHQDQDRPWSVNVYNEIGAYQRLLSHKDVEILKLAPEEEVIKMFEEGKQQVTILDIGSGGYGRFIRSFSDLEKVPKLFDYLKTHPDKQLRVVGLTAGSRNKAVLSKQDVPNSIDFENGSLINVEKYDYTLTRASTLENFLEQTNIESLDLVFATHSLQYLGPKNFEDNFTQMVDRLSPGGKAFIIEYSQFPGTLDYLPSLGTYSLKVGSSSELEELDRGLISREPKNEQSKAELLGRFINVTSGFARGVGKDRMVEIFRNETWLSDDFETKNGEFTEGQVVKGYTPVQAIQVKEQIIDAISSEDVKGALKSFLKPEHLELLNLNFLVPGIKNHIEENEKAKDILMYDKKANVVGKKLFDSKKNKGYLGRHFAYIEKVK